MRKIEAIKAKLDRIGGYNDELIKQRKEGAEDEETIYRLFSIAEELGNVDMFLGQLLELLEK